MPPAVADFKLSITKALADQLSSALGGLTPDPLLEEKILELEGRPGVYELYLNGDRVYVGKAQRSLRARLDGSSDLSVGRCSSVGPVAGCGEQDA